MSQTLVENGADLVAAVVCRKLVEGIEGCVDIQRMMAVDVVGVEAV